ncbi:MAG: ABC transporter ATP-binding protein, partial [Clostridia bacterium]|nr:ABC transporter ATP-binding protein [Clostridia bacterium]
TPQNLYDKPVNIFVAGFIGTPQMNFINGTLTKQGDDVYFNFDGNSIKLPAEKNAADEDGNKPLAEYIGKEVVAGLRPECIHDDPMHINAMPESCIDVDVDVTELMGAEIYLYLNSYDRTPKEGMSSGKEIVEDPTRMIARVSSRSTSRAGDQIRVALDVSRIHIFDKDTERCIVH